MKGPGPGGPTGRAGGIIRYHRPMNPMRLVKDLVLALHGGGQPKNLAAGFALGAAMGLVPKGNLLGAAFFLLFFAFNVHKGAALFSAALFTALGYALDGAAHRIGWALLQAPALNGLWTALYDMPVVPLTRFNNTVVLGSLVLGLGLYAPLYFGFLRALGWYDATVRARVERLSVVRAVKGWSWYDRYQRWLQ